MISNDFKEPSIKLMLFMDLQLHQLHLRWRQSEDPLEMYLNDVFTVPVNLAGLPAISVPVGLDEGTIGMQLIENSFNEEKILSLASVLKSLQNLN